MHWPYHFSYTLIKFLITFMFIFICFDYCVAHVIEIWEGWCVCLCVGVQDFPAGGAGQSDTRACDEV